jgi:putative ABC transport system permease protein
MAFFNLWRRKLRTLLTILAVVIGATLVALMVSIASGMQSFIVRQFGMALSPEAIIVTSQPGAFQFADSGPHQINSTQEVVAQPFTADDIHKIAAIPGVERIDYPVSVNALYIRPQDSNNMYSVSLSVTPEYDEKLRPLLAGAYFGDSDTGKCLLSYDYVNIFGWTDVNAALGQPVTIVVKRNSNSETNSFQFIVIGVLDKTIASTDVLIPTTDGKAMGRYQRNNNKLYSEAQPGSTITVKVQHKSRVSGVAKAIDDLGFGAHTPAEILSRINTVFSVIQIGLGAFGGIALVVAAIGIINALLMAIYERTREIGIMKAVGATRSDIRLLFTAEGGALGLIGGIIGCLLAWVLGQALNIIGARTFLSGFPGFNMSVLSLWLVVGVVAITTAISLLAALYPAARAARLDPVEALRYE